MFLCLVLILFGFASIAPVAAFEMRQGESVTVPKGTTINGSLFAAGSAITIDGTVNGDLFCGGQTIVVRGTINGDIICAGQTLTVSGAVSGNIRAVGQLIEVAGPVRRNITAAGQTITMTPGAVISGEVLAAGQTVALGSTIGRDVMAYAQKVSLGEKARISGDLTYTSVGELTQATGAAVTGTITHLLPPKDDWSKPAVKKDWMPKQKPWAQSAVGSIIFYLIVGAAVVFIGPKYATRVTEQMQTRPLVGGLVGFLSFMVVPMMIIMMAITLIGIPFAMIVGLLFGLAVLICRVYVALIAGERVLGLFGRKKPQVLTQALVGIPVLWFLFHVPVLGWILSALAVFWGMGGIVLALRKR